MSWLEKLLPPKIQPTDPSERRSVPEGLWIKCPSCETVLYKTDLEQNDNVCPKCAHHHRIGARARLDSFLDPEGRYEIAQEVVPVDPLPVGIAVSGWPLRSQFVGVDGPVDPGVATNPMPTVPPTGSVAFHPALVIVYRVPTCDTTAPSQTLVRLAARSNWTVQFGTATTSLLANCTWPWNPLPQFWVTV